jgi:mitochondrial fusion and transport protein UGO1
LNPGYIPTDIILSLVLTPTSHGPRALLPSLRALPSLTCPTVLLPITLLHSTLPAFIRTSMPVFLRSSLSIDPIHTPGTYSLSAFLISLGELFVRLPLETVLRRGHATVLSDSATTQSQRQRPTMLPLHGASSASNQRFKAIVPVGPYKGILGTMLYIVHEEGYRTPPGPSKPAALQPASSRSSSSQSNRRQPQEPRKKRGQGVSGLWRGWRVGLFGLLGMWTAAGIGASGGEF